VIGHAVRVGWQQRHPEVPSEAYGPHKAEAWDLFYRSSPADCRRWQLLALQELADRDAAPAAMIPAAGV